MTNKKKSLSRGGSGKRMKGRSAVGGQRDGYHFGGLKRIKISMVSVYASSSDLLLKKHLVRIDHALSKVGQLTGYRFSWKRQDTSQTRRRQVGLLAQDVERVLPEAVSRTKDPGAPIETLLVDYPKLSALLVEAIKELQQQISLIQQRLDLRSVAPRNQA